MAARIVGLDIGSSRIRAVEVSQHPKHGVKVHRAAEVTLRRDVVTSSEVLDRDELESAIKALWKAGKFSTRDVRVAFSSDKVLVRVLDKDWMVDSDFAKVLTLVVRDDLPTDASAYYLDYHTIDEFEVENKKGSLDKKKRIFLTGASRRSVDELVYSLQLAKLKPQSIDILGLAFLRALPRIETPENEIDVCVDMGAANTTIVVSRDGQPLYLRVLSEIGGFNIDDAIVQELELEGAQGKEEAEEKKMDVLHKSAAVAAARAKKLEAEDSVFQQEDKPVNNDITITEEMIIVSRIITNELVKIVSSVQNTLDDYFDRNNGSKKINTFTISGGLAGTPNIAARLSSEFKTNVTVAKPFDGYETPSVGAEILANQHEYLGAFGLALGTGAAHA